MGLEPRRKSRKGDVVSFRFTVVPHVARVSSGLDEGCGGFAAKFGWLSRVGWRGVRGREEWMSPDVYVEDSRRGKKAIRDELASEERCVEQWHHEERFIGILGASVRL